MMAEQDVTPRPEWNATGGDHDQPYRWGNPMLTERERARLLVLRGRLQDGFLRDDREGD